MTARALAIRTAMVLLCGGLAAPGRAEDVAIATDVAGRCTRQSAGEPARPVVPFDWLPSGVTVETTAGSSLVLAFANGKRWRIAEGAAATLTASGVSNPRGT